MATFIYACNCVDSYQDGKYGKGKRVHTLGNGKRVCTKCAKVTQDGSIVSTAKSKARDKKAGK